MRLLFDQGTPVPISQHLAGHTIGISADLGWARLRNGDLLAVAEEAGYELLLKVPAIRSRSLTRTTRATTTASAHPER